MKFDNPTALQNRMAAEAKQIRATADDLRALADQLCNEGQHEASSLARQMAGHLDIVYGLGRALKFTIGGAEVSPLSGGK